ncbi:MMPL family transporter [Thermococcus thioreducens]|uniref:MMPL family protein n=1 Tax=Thermococcus thioreducens TaxID=277988 RepID=A0A0Q2QSY9_9EURY|nr:MMPL family transporter [Thermococcus thioreducens]ASJ12419.1 multidrug RND transporter [Thermococcus thioreducens]KQH83149.1 multidrug RND transporter [Thermococcus thioreducens]SEV91175.1 MMPL family protein [Thermococcus thioreducens]
MPWNDWIVKHAKAIVAIWIIAVIAAMPLAVKLSNLTNYSMDQFLPKDVESVKVQDTLAKEFPEFSTSDNQTYMIVSGVDINDPATKEAYERFKAEAKPYGSNFTSYYDAVDLLHNKSYEIALNLTQTTANLTGIFYSSAINASNAYVTLLSQVENLSEQVKTLNGTVPQLARAYLALEANLTVLYNQSLALRKAINETDNAYVVLHENLTGASEQLKALNSTIAGLNAGLYNLSDNYAGTYLGTIGAYGALVQAGAYEGGLDGATAQAIAEKLGVPVELVYAVYNSTYPAYSAYGSGAITDGFLANVTKAMVLGQISDPMQKNLTEAYSVAFYQGVVAFDGQAGSNYALIQLGENAVKSVDGIAINALKNPPLVVEGVGGSYDVPGFGKVPAETLAYIVNVSISLGRNPSASAIENATIEATNALMKGIPLLEMPNADEILRTLLVYGPTRGLEENLLAGVLKEKLPEEQKDLAEPIVRTVVNFDPNATGVLSKDPTLLKKATVSLLTEMLKERGVELPESVISEVYDSNGNVAPIAREILIQKTSEEVGSEKVAEAIVDTVLKNPEELEKGKGVKETVKEIITSLAGDVPIDLGKAVDEVYAGKSPEEIAYSLFEQGVDEKLANVSAPEDVKEALREIMLTVARDYPMSDSEVEALVKVKTLKLVEKFAGEIDLGVPLHINAAELVNIAFEFRNNPDAITNEDVKPIEEQVYPSIYSLAKSYIGMLKSPDNRTMLILFVPKGLNGVSDLEKQSKAQYESSLKVKEVALKEFGKVSPEVKAYVTGTPIQTYEAIKYGKEDNDKTTKFSIAGALLVLLVLMGAALLATLLPFTGVATATLTALGILYLLAKGDYLDVGSWAQMLTVTTALGLGIDYSTYYLHRFREYLAEGYDHSKAASEALKRAKDAVLASASTDIIAFASFILAWEFPIFKTMGIIAPLAVIIVLLASLTFIPAITVLIGDKPAFWWPRHIEHHLSNVNLHERSRIAEWAVKHAKIVVVIALLLAVPAAYNFANFNGTHDIKLFIPKDSETYNFLQLSESTVGAGVTSPTYVVIDLGHPLSDGDLKTIEALAGRISKVEGVEYVYTVTRPYGRPVNVSVEELKSIGGDRYISEDGTKVLIQVTGKYEATDDRSKDMVREIRAIVKDGEKSGAIKSGMVGGNTALALDLSDLINDVFWHRIFPVALLLMFLSLIPTLKGLPAVITTIGTIAVGVLLSITVSSWLFERVFGQQVMWFLPMMVFVVLMGVGIDYNSFYLVKARDEFERRSARDALVVAAGTMDTLVVGLAAVLAVTYGSLMTGATWGIREIGFALAIGVLLTATAAVYFIGPATMALFGEKAWWPLHKGRKE